MRLVLPVLSNLSGKRGEKGPETKRKGSRNEEKGGETGLKPLETGLKPLETGLNLSNPEEAGQDLERRARTLKARKEQKRQKRLKRGSNPLLNPQNCQ